MIGVDPASFASGAFWRQGFADASLGRLLGRLDQAPPGRQPPSWPGRRWPTPALWTSADAGRDGGGHGRSVPGMTSSDRSLLVVSSAGFDAAAGGKRDQASWRTELWARGDPGAALAALRRAGQAPAAVTTAAGQMRDGGVRGPGLDLRAAVGPWRPGRDGRPGRPGPLRPGPPAGAGSSPTP